MGIKNVIRKVAGKGADTVAKLSALSPDQLEQVQAKREEFLSDFPNMTGAETEELTNRLLAANAVEIYNAYLPQIEDLYIPVEKETEYGEDFRSSNNIRYINITKWVIDKKENSLEKLVNVYEVLSNDACNISLVFHRKVIKTDVYLAITNIDNDDNNVDIESYRRRLESAIQGNFPGSSWKEEIGRGKLPCFNNNAHYSVATASNVPTEKSEKFVSQTIEKLLDGIIPATAQQEYILVLLATPIQDIAERKLILSQIYSDLAPYASWQTNYTYTEADARGSAATVGINVGASAGTQTGTNSSVTVENNVGVDTPVGLKFGINENVSNSTTLDINISRARTIGKSLSKAFSKSMTKGTSLAKTASKAVSKSTALATGASKALNFGMNFGANFARTSNVTATIGKNEGITQSFTNHNIKHALELLEEQMKRLEKSTALGMWDFAAYILSEDQTVANNVAYSYLALTQGEESHMSQTVVNLWRGDVQEEQAKANEIFGYLKDLRHPMFALNPELLENDESFSVYPAVVTATTALSGKELAYSLNFPQKSIAGLPVFECAEFGRNINSYEETERDFVKLGKIFHMNHTEQLDAKISLNSLASHTFISGSTGTGKSNTVYEILDEVRKHGVKFLVVEPVKGEYKHIFGNDENVSVYGTNPELSDLLRINPFAFPKGIHVLEHLDRLIEIFNVCWPMYAAMPAVLKNAVERAYEDSGWDLLKSINSYGDLYPTFADVTRNIKEIIDSSEYDNENKGAYKGSLLTRLESLTNGINGMIFTNQAITDKELFDENVIIDLSRVGSTETKSLIMGMLVLKLQEYRMTHTDSLNNLLKHVTVLEEAHNILKRTSNEQSMEDSNLVGKSVEMIANGIAEMRTYGEGFIIADQAPGLMDRAVIRNTNTKIIMRLPDFSDRELVGKSANLNDDQITELAKLPKGVAALYQNEWIEPILCKIDQFNGLENCFEYHNQVTNPESHFSRDIVVEYLSSKRVDEQILKEINFKRFLSQLGIDSLTVRRILDWGRELFSMHSYSQIVSQLYPELLDLLRKQSLKDTDVATMTDTLQNEINNRVSDLLSEQAKRDLLQATMTYYYLYELKNNSAFQDWTNNGGF
ncbi:ATP-binding protein [Streptococcus mutans]|nr:ATP-binding protein [Streptococcus mutans]